MALNVNVLSDGFYELFKLMIKDPENAKDAWNKGVPELMINYLKSGDFIVACTGVVNGGQFVGTATVTMELKTEPGKIMFENLNDGINGSGCKDFSEWDDGEKLNKLFTGSGADVYHGTREIDKINESFDYYSFGGVLSRFLQQKECLKMKISGTAKIGNTVVAIIINEDGIGEFNVPNIFFDLAMNAMYLYHKKMMLYPPLGIKNDSLSTDQWNRKYADELATQLHVLISVGLTVSGKGNEDNIKLVVCAGTLA